MKRKNYNQFAYPYILESIDPEAYEVECKTDTEKLQFLFDTFKAEYVYPENLKRYGNLQNCFAEWLKGLPSAVHIAWENYRIIEIAKLWGSLPENSTESQNWKIINNWFNFIANKTFQLFRKHKIS